MLRISPAVLSSFVCLFGAAEQAAAADVPASHCIEVSAFRGGATAAKGVLTNTCDLHVAVVYGFDTKFDGTRKVRPWCQYEGDYGNEHAVGRKGQILDPGEQLSVGHSFPPDIRFGVHWAACAIDTSANNAVFFLIESPYFAFDGTCGFECQ
ncbi:MAG: hypothetical protein MUF73_01195 [Rhodobacteraceae bacterium]|jgi:hypothetical protein|nr:hypothetical protein [Paracoccaceae bacterium]